MAYDTNNPFARILRGEAPCHEVYRDDAILVFMDLMPQAPGHTLVIPAAEAVDIFDLPPDSVASVARGVQRAAKAVQQAMQAPGVLIAQLNGVEAGQTVFHYHVHIIPRREGLDLALHARSVADAQELASNAERIRHAWDKLASDKEVG